MSATEKVPIHIHTDTSIERQREEVKINLSERRRGKPKIGVTSAGYDNIGEVLKGLGYQFENLQDSHLGDSDLSSFDTIFLNCSSDCLLHAPSAKQALKRYVARGGSIYASDFAAAYIQEAFPEFFSYRTGGRAGNFKVSVVDKGLRQILGSSINLNFDMPDWKIVAHLTPGHRQYLVSEDGPFLVSFGYKKGQVLFTSFHNRAQPSREENALLNFLILKPLATKCSTRFEALSEQEKGLAQETPSTAKLEKQDKFEYQNDKLMTLVFLLNWSGQAKFRLSVWKPSGKLLSSVSSSTPPCAIRCPSAESGKWQYTIQALRVPYPNFHYVATVGSEELLRALPFPKGSSEQLSV